MDTDGLLFLERAAEILRASGLSVADLRRVDREEVAPAVWYECFYGDWVATESTLNGIEARLARPAWRRFLNRWVTRPWTLWMAREWWSRLAPLLRDGVRDDR
jgi:hypothetical protein